MTAPLRVIFLDIDGVLNSQPFVERRASFGWEDLVDPRAVERLNRLVRSASAKIVISSSWRCQMDLDRVVSILRSHGLEGDVIGATPRGTSRPTEIQRWLDGAVVAPESMVILDDLPEMEHLSPYFVQTTWEEGLLEHHVDAALVILAVARAGGETV